MADNPSVSTRIPLEWRRELTQIAEENDTTISKILHDLIGQLLCKPGVYRVGIVDGKLQLIAPDSDLQSPEALVDTMLTDSAAPSEDADNQLLTVSPYRLPEPFPSAQPIATCTSPGETPQMREPLDDSSVKGEPSALTEIEPERQTFSEELEISDTGKDNSQVKQNSWIEKAKGAWRATKAFFWGASKKAVPTDLSDQPVMSELTDGAGLLLEEVGGAESGHQLLERSEFHPEEPSIAVVSAQGIETAPTPEQEEEWSKLSPEQISELLDDWDYADRPKLCQWFVKSKHFKFPHFDPETRTLLISRSSD